MARVVERAGVAGLRRRLLEGVSGRVVEVGAGTGANFAHYPPEVTQVVAVEPEAVLRAEAERAAESLALPISVVDGVAAHLPAGDGEFDAAVAALVLCSVPDQATALAEMRRVLRPGGRLYFWEHVRAEGEPLARVQRALDATLWPVLGGGCHLTRDTAAAIEAAGFTFERLERFRLPERGIPLPPSPQILGVAVRD
jgi:ubiquinone/menaquinone biosynthesis C-methylase UbiE